jgi:hypothetical protein
VASYWPKVRPFSSLAFGPGRPEIICIESCPLFDTLANEGQKSRLERRAAKRVP